MTRRGRAALTAAVSCVAITALAWLAFPVASQDFWLHAVKHSHRIGETRHLSNQSITGMLARAGGAPGWLYLGLIALAAGAGLWAARAAFTWGCAQAGFVLAGMTMNLVSPISWMHHFVPLCLALVLVWQAGLAATGRRRRWLLATAAAAYALLVARLPYLGDSLSRAGGWVHVLSVPARESYLLLTIAMMAVLFAAVAPRQRNGPAPGPLAGPGDPRPARAREALVR